MAQRHVAERPQLAGLGTAMRVPPKSLPVHLGAVPAAGLAEQVEQGPAVTVGRLILRWLGACPALLRRRAASWW